MSKFVFNGALKELRFHLSQTGEASVPLRNFLSNNYGSLKQASNNAIPILVREAYGVPPTLTARYEHGKEIKKKLEGLSESAISEELAVLVKSS